MKKLIKITDNHYVVVDDSEIEQDDYITRLSNKEITKANDEWSGDTHEDWKKITDSTQLLGVKPITDKVVIQEDKAGNPLMSAQYVELDMSSTVKPLSLKEVKELIGEVDVEKKAEEYADYNNSYVPLSYG